MSHNGLWWLGQVVAIVVAIALRHDGYSFATTLAIYAIIAILVDIRENTEHKKGGAA